MKTKIVKGLLVLIGSVALLAGCSTANQGGMPDGTLYNAGDGGGNGSVSHTNPLGLGTGSGAGR